MAGWGASFSKWVFRMGCLGWLLLFSHALADESTAPSSDEPPPPTIRLEGNLVVDSEELWAAMGVKPDATITPRLAGLLRQRLKKLLLEAGLYPGACG